MKKFILSNSYSLLVNIFLISFLLIAIQNSQEKKFIKILNTETIELPISFILGTSFVIGSLSGNLVFSILNFKNNQVKD